MKFTKQIKELRSKIPIGINRAKTILEKNEGNIDLSIEQYQSELIKILIEKTDSSPEYAKETLKQSQFNLHEAIKIINESKLSTTENILNRNTNNEQKSTHLFRAIINENFTFDTYRVNNKKFNELNTHQKDFLILIEWLDYLECEGFFSAAHSDLFEEVITILNSKLNMETLSFELKNAHEIRTKIKNKHDLTPGTNESYTQYWNELDNHKVFSKVEEILWKEKEGNLYKKLMEYVEQNILSFP
jgi:hypothetical protein